MQRLLARSGRRAHAALVVLLLCAVLATGNLAVRPDALTSDSATAAWADGSDRWSLWPAREASAAMMSGSLSGAAEATPADAFLALQQRAGAPVEVAWNARSGIPDFLAAHDGALRLPYTPTAAERGNPVAIARGFLDENRTLYRLGDAAAELALVRVEPDRQLNFAHVRLAQRYRGIPVFGKQLIVHLDARERIVAVNGRYVPSLDLPTQPTILTEAAEQIALADLLETQLEPEERARVATTVLTDRTELMVYVDDDQKATLTWRVTILTDSPLGQWRTFVNARRPAVVHRFDSAANEKRRRTFTAQNGTSVPGRLVMDEGERSSDPVAQAAHDAAGRVYDYYTGTFQRQGIDGQGGAMVSTVHYGSDPADAENAAWIGEMKQMIYGDGGRIFKPLAYGLDVVGHEFTHGVIDSTADLIYQGQSGALNESYADVFGALINGGRWALGEQVVKSPPFPTTYLRSLEDPNAGGRYDPRNPLGGVGQPAHMREYANLPLSRRADNGGVHVNSGIPNRAAFLVAQAVGVQKMEQIYYRTLSQHLGPDANFLDAARATVRSATDLYGGADAEMVRNALVQVGLELGGSSAPPPPASTGPRQGPVTPPASQALPAGCVNLVNNGGFESEVGWTEVSTNRSVIIDPERPYTGARSAWLGGTDKEPVQYVYQDLNLPANATSIQLSYFRQIHEETTGSVGGSASNAKFSVLLATTGGEVIGAVEQLSSSGGNDTWSEARGDLAQLAGQTVRLVFGSENPRNNVSSFFVDDVAVVACTTGAGPAAPTTTSQDLVYIQGRIVGADTGRGVSGAQIFVLQPNISASQAAADDNITSSEVLTLGVTDADGVYQTEAAIPRGQTYSVIIIARGFRPVVADGGMPVPPTASNPFPVNATLRAAR